MDADLVGEESAKVGEGGHVGELEEGPAPGVCFAADDGEGGHALHGEDVEDQEGEGGGEGEDGCAVGAGFFAHGLVEGLGLFVAVGGFFANAVDDGEGGDEDFACCEGAEEADADLPVIAEWFDGGFDEMTDASGEGIAKGVLLGEEVGLVV